MHRSIFPYFPYTLAMQKDETPCMLLLEMINVVFEEGVEECIIILVDSAAATTINTCISESRTGA